MVQDILLLTENHIQHILSIVFEDPFFVGKLKRIQHIQKFLNEKYYVTY